MPETVGVVIATFGDWEYWRRVGRTAVASLHAQTRQADAWRWLHGEGLAETRNFGAAELDTDFLIFLDADDALDPGYIEAMLAGSDDIRRPATLGVYLDGSQDTEAVLIQKKDLAIANYIVIGAMCRREHFLAVGGFDETLPCLEDWDLWRRMVSSGAVVSDVPDAIYRVGVNPNSRNQNSALHGVAYQKICAKPYG